MEGIRYEVDYFDVIYGNPKEHASESVNLDNGTKPLEEHEYAVVHVYPLDNVEAYTDVYALVGGLKNLADGSLTEGVFRQRIKTKHASLPYTKSIALTPEEVGLSATATVEDVIRRVAQPDGTSNELRPIRGCSGGGSHYVVHYFGYDSMTAIAKDQTDKIETPIALGDADGVGRECAIIHLRPYYNYSGYTDIFMFVGGKEENLPEYDRFIAGRLPQDLSTYLSYTPEDFGEIPEGRGNVRDWISILSGFEVGGQDFVLPPEYTANSIRVSGGSAGFYVVSYFDKITMEPVWRSYVGPINITPEEEENIFAIFQVWVWNPFLDTSGPTIEVVPQIFGASNAPQVINGNAAIVSIREWANKIFGNSEQAYGSHNAHNRMKLLWDAVDNTIQAQTTHILHAQELQSMRRRK